jgi:nitrite reductase (NADH) small subunit
MGGFQRVAHVDEVPPGQSKVVTLNDRAIALFNVGGKFYAIHNICPHEGGPLNKGRLKGHVVACPWHDLAFDIRNGQGIDGGGYCVGSYEVRVEGSDILVGPRRRV